MVGAFDDNLDVVMFVVSSDTWLLDVIVVEKSQETVEYLNEELIEDDDENRDDVDVIMLESAESFKLLDSCLFRLMLKLSFLLLLLLNLLINTELKKLAIVRIRCKPKSVDRQLSR